MQKQPTLYILCGLPYAGKSVLTTELIKRFGFEVGSVDIQINKYHFEVDEMSQDDWGLVYSEAYENVKNKLINGKSVVFDMGHLKKSERETAKQIALACGAKYKIIYINTPKNIIEQRWAENKQTQIRGHLSRKALDNAYNLWEEPTADESPIIYNTDMNIASWVDTNINSD